MKLLNAFCVVPAIVVAMAACDSTVTESDLQKWTNNEVGFDKVTTVIQDKTQPMPTRVRALEVVVEKGHEIRVRGMIDPIADEADRLAVARQLVDQLMKHVQNKSSAQLQAKDAAMTLVRYLPPEQVDFVRKTVADWAFADINWDTPADELKNKLESRVSAGQVADLGPYGLEPAAILLSHGFVAEQMVRYLSAAKSAEATALLLRGFKKYLPVYGPNAFYLDSLRRLEDPAVAVLMLEFYQNKALEQDVRDAYFANAVAMLELPKIKDNAEGKNAITNQFLALAKDGNAEDVWLASANINTLTGAQRLSEVFALFTEDRRYREAAEDPGKSVLDFCFDLESLQKPAELQPVLKTQLATGNRIQKAMALLCTKTMRLDALRPDIARLSALLNKSEDPSVADFLGEVELGDPPRATPLTLGFLAQNVLDGLNQLATAENDLKAGKLTADRHTSKRFMIVVEFETIGEAYTKVIAERYDTWVAEQAAPAPAPTPAPNP